MHPTLVEIGVVDRWFSLLQVETRYWSIPSLALIMKSKLKNGLCSAVPLHLQGESATRFCMFPKVKSVCCSPGNTPVYLNVYDLTPVNGYFYWAGIGVFHTGVEGESTFNFWCMFLRSRPYFGLGSWYIHLVCLEHLLYVKLVGLKVHPWETHNLKWFSKFRAATKILVLMTSEDDKSGSSLELSLARVCVHLCISLMSKVNTMK